ncbi:MAG: gliding motility-associated C-terminal domain-containing protein [Bacteroidales bacterium]|nr:gliding motility-associated C-terminal domain-containing protein [Bacteroidales bacterium]MDD5976343.1 gliding motility-associated C-terminal domain-containing protein [Bacteroidales bacterium]MDD7540447.1 gliding motility-associated C-terminal domain-containing protein [Bacteroidales bacterium]MDY5800409.1 gliding motility-associated C-terminal domain-containing protein [Candidatus Onthomorpha sp.]
MEDMDKNFEEFRERLKNFSEQPPEAMWDNISKQVAKPRHTGLVVSIVAVTLVLAGFVALLVSAPKGSTSKTSQTLSQTKNTENSLAVNTSKSEQSKTPFYSAKTPKEINETPFYSDETAKEQNHSAATNLQGENLQISTVQTKQENASSKNPNIIAAEPKKVEKNRNGNPLPQKTASINRELKTDTQKAPEISQRDTVRSQLFVPNAFTPLSDKNNLFKPAQADVSDYRMNIYNRQGVLLFDSEDITHGWDGRSKGEVCPSGTYVYVISFRDTEGKPHTQKGTLMLLK